MKKILIILLILMGVSRILASCISYHELRTKSNEGQSKHESFKTFNPGWSR